MPRNGSTRTSGLSTNQAPVAIKREDSDSYRPVRTIKQEADEEKKPLRDMDSQASNSNNVVVKQEEPQNTKKHAHLHTRTPARFHWEEATIAAKDKVRELDIVELQPNQVGRIMEAGKLTGIYHTDWVRTVESFIIYDGLDVLARVQDLDMENAVYEIAALYIGRKLKWSHPHDHDLDVSSVPMTGEHAGSYAVKMSPMMDEPPKKQRKARKN
ncbi:uncharacterized protein PG986_010174 [Apiospora aurea]|uniref:Uncharacterized protein n=1 Tax=Apiospora aurea TaxID=335848 RepID=A0ABR1QA53_9PEZI